MKRPDRRERPTPMTHTERVAEIKGRFGFTERQAGFLVTVMLHAGVCLARQYCAFARIKYGEPMRTFFQMLEARRFVTPQTCAHGRARLFHVHYKPLYAAIGEPDNRFRRPMTLARAIERLMVLDAVLADPSLTWLATEREKVAHFTGDGVPRHHLPALTFRSADDETVRYFPDKHAELLRSLPAWTIRLLVPRHLTGAAGLHREAFVEQLTTPLPAEVVDEMRWYFHACRDGGIDLDERYYRAQTAFAGPRFRALYRRWLMDGERVLDAAMSGVLVDVFARRVGVLESVVLPHPYLHLLSLAGTA